jgi:energy-coupling factor transporter ATP-binding protein EcfA2
MPHKIEEVAGILAKRLESTETHSPGLQGDTDVGGSTSFLWHSDCSTFFIFDSIFDELALGLRYFNANEETISQQVKVLLQEVGLGYLYSISRVISPFELSGGQQQRLLVSIVVSRRLSKLILIDPFIHVDIQGQNQLCQYICRYADYSKMTIVFSPLFEGFPIMANATRLYHNGIDFFISKDPPITSFDKETLQQQSKVNHALGPINTRRSVCIDLRNCYFQHENGRIGISFSNISLYHGHCYILAGPNGGGKSSFCRFLAEQSWLHRSCLYLVHERRISNPVRELVSTRVLRPLFQDINIHYQPGQIRDLLGDSPNSCPLVEAFLISPFLCHDLLDVPRWVKQVVHLILANQSKSHILVLDEPIDDYILDYILEPAISLFRNWRAEGRTVIIATHSARLGVAVASDFFWVEHGKIYSPNSSEWNSKAVPIINNWLGETLL